MKSKKEELLYWACRAEEAGLCITKGGNFSLWDEENEVVLITPAGQDRKVALAEEMSVLTIEGEWIGGNKPSSEYQMHLAIYRARPDIGGIAHTHSHFATVMAVWEKPIPPIVYEVLIYGGTVPVAPYGRPGTEELAEIARDALLEKEACLLAHHGVLAIGKDIEDAFLKSMYVEETAKVYYHALLLGQGKEPPLLELEELHAWKYPDVKK